MKKEKKPRALQKWEPFFGDMLTFKKSIDDMFADFSHRFNRGLNLRFPSLLKEPLSLWKPEIDMYETEKEVVVEANLPGCDKNDIKINIENNILNISGEKKEEKETKNKNFYQREQRYGSFQRSMVLPGYVDASRADAKCVKGVLKVIFPRVEISAAEKKEIKIS